MTTLSAIAAIANIVSIVFYLSPILIMITLFKDKNTKTVPTLLFLFTILNCELWFIYGVQDRSWEIYLNNGIGWVLNVAYITTYFFFLQKFWKKISLFVGLFVFMAFVFTYLYRFKSDKSVTGLLAMVMNILMFLSPLQKTYEVIKQKTNRYIPLFTIISLFAASSLWITVGMLKDMDRFIIVPNGIGIGISLFQIFLYYYYKGEEIEPVEANNTEPKTEESKKDKEDYEGPHKIEVFVPQQ